MKKDKTRSKQCPGFTVVEVLISVSVFAILSTMVVVNYRNGNKVQNLNQSVGIVEQTLRFAQNKALQSAGTQSCVSGTCTLNVPKAFGVYFQYPAGKELIIFADTKNQSGQSTPNNLYDVGQDEILEKRSLSNDIVLNSCQASAPACGVTPCSCSIAFTTNTGDVFINATSGSQVSANIELQNTKNTNKKNVLLNGITGVVEQDPNQ